MQDPGSVQDILMRMSAIAPLTEQDAEQLQPLLNGVKAAADRMASLAPVFPGEVDTSKLSVTADGE